MRKSIVVVMLALGLLVGVGMATFGYGQEAPTLCEQGRIELRFSGVAWQFRFGAEDGKGGWRAPGLFRAALQKALSGVPRAASLVSLDAFLHMVTTGVAVLSFAQVISALLTEGKLDTPAATLFTISTITIIGADYFLLHQAADIYNNEFEQRCE